MIEDKEHNEHVLRIERTKNAISLLTLEELAEVMDWMASMGYWRKS